MFDPNSEFDFVMLRKPVLNQLAHILMFNDAANEKERSLLLDLIPKVGKLLQIISSDAPDEAIESAHQELADLASLFDSLKHLTSIP
jgi:hypothetical protein